MASLLALEEDSGFICIRVESNVILVIGSRINFMALERESTSTTNSTKDISLKTS